MDLKPCPFCGGKDIHIEDKEDWSYVLCYDCLASFWQQEATCPEDNAEAWNRRPEFYVKQKLNLSHDELEQLKKRLRKERPCVLPYT